MSNSQQETISFCACERWRSLIHRRSARKGAAGILGATALSHASSTPV
jgi:hypothetical protein